MKFICSVTINRPKEKVARLFADPGTLKEYQEGFLKKEPVSGDAGKEGAVSKMFYRTGKQEMELIETITVNRLPDEFNASYHHKNMDNTMKSTFTAIDDHTTRYDAEIEYTAFRGFIPKIMGLFFRGMFKSQVRKWLDNFKRFAEKEDR